VLRGVVIPPIGGDTVWANTVAAYETLPPLLRSLADQLWALHSNVYDYTAMRPNATAQQVQRYETVFKSTIYETEHPVVQVHPLSGDRAISGDFVRRLLGVSSAESTHLFAMLQDRVTRLEKHGALALVRGRCGDLGQSRDTAQGHRRLRRPVAHRAPRYDRRAGVRWHRWPARQNA